MRQDASNLVTFPSLHSLIVRHSALGTHTSTTHRPSPSPSLTPSPPCEATRDTYLRPGTHCINTDFDSRERQRSRLGYPGDPGWTQQTAERSTELYQRD